MCQVFKTAELLTPDQPGLSLAIWLTTVASTAGSDIATCDLRPLRPFRTAAPSTAVLVNGRSLRAGGAATLRRDTKPQRHPVAAALWTN